MHIDWSNHLAPPSLPAWDPTPSDSPRYLAGNTAHCSMSPSFLQFPILCHPDRTPIALRSLPRPSVSTLPFKTQWIGPCKYLYALITPAVSISPTVTQVPSNRAISDSSLCPMEQARGTFFLKFSRLLLFCSCDGTIIVCKYSRLVPAASMPHHPLNSLPHSTLVEGPVYFGVFSQWKSSLWFHALSLSC